MRRIFWTWLIPGIVIGFIIGMTLGVYLQSKADAQIAQLAADRKSAEMEMVADRFDDVLASLKRTTVLASFYGQREHGRPTASGQKFDMNAMTAAHKELPFGTILLVENLKTNRFAIVRINDRGPFVPKRSLDVSLAVARELGMLDDGIAIVRIAVLTRGK